MYQPVFPENTELQKLMWDGLPYYFYIAEYAESFRVQVTCYEKDYYSEVYKRDITDEIAEFEAMGNFEYVTDYSAYITE